MTELRREPRGVRALKTAWAWTTERAERARQSAAVQAVGAWTAERAERARRSAAAQAVGAWAAERARRARGSAAAQAVGAWAAERTRRARGSAKVQAVGAWTAERTRRARARVGERAGHMLAAGGVRAAATAVELATGPIGGALVTAGAEAAVLAIATDAVRRALAERAPGADVRVVLAVVIAELAQAGLCDGHVADGWRVACGIGEPGRGGPALALGLRRAAVSVVGSRVTTAALRRVGLKRLLWVGPAVALVRLPGELRRACELVRRAEQRARTLAGEGGVAARRTA